MMCPLPPKNLHDGIGMGRQISSGPIWHHHGRQSPLRAAKVELRRYFGVAFCVIMACDVASSFDRCVSYIPMRLLVVLGFVGIVINAFPRKCQIEHIVKRNIYLDK